MSTFRIGDSWVTFDGLTVGTGGGKMASKQDAHDRKGKGKKKAVRK